ncbi:LysR family transcriptional regulator [Roseateles cavernae]|uniref:LysR family transcriptional regulator n=1 Tax=Roseateles cavernae TaxID=3153578 RepID=UPI0010F575AF
MEIYQLRAFVTAAKLGNITRTAEALHLTQPAITGQIKALEEGLGVTLFDRRPGRINLTRAGEALLADAEQVLTAAGHLLGKARDLQGEVTGSLTLGTVADPDTLRLGSLLGALVRDLPLLEIRTRNGPAEELREQVAAGLLQGAFYIGPSIPQEAAGLALQTIHYRIAGPASQAQALLHAGWRDIAAMPWIGAPAQHHVQTLMRDMFARQGLSPHQVIESDESSLPQSLVRAGVGLSLLREDVALPASERGEIVIWPHARVGAMLSFIYPRAAEHEPAIVATLSLLRSVWGLSA